METNPLGKLEGKPSQFFVNPKEKSLNPWRKLFNMAYLLGNSRYSQRTRKIP